MHLTDRALPVRALTIGAGILLLSASESLHAQPAMTTLNKSDCSSMLSALQAHGPNEGLREKLQLFGQFVGSWDLTINYFAANGTLIRTVAGEWHFEWVLEGRAIQDVWITPPRSARAGTSDEGYGTTLRFCDPKIDAWRSTWIGPNKGVVLPFIARQQGSEIVLEGSFEEGVSTRWIFSEITPRSFHWRSVFSRDGWKTLTLDQEMLAKRMAP